MRLIPALRNEVQWDTKGQVAKTMTTKDAVSFRFKNGSILKNVPVSEATRGQRFQSILIEEIASADQEKITEIIMPTLTVSRKVGRTNKSDPNEVLNQSAIMVTSAGFKGTYAYDKLIDTLCHMVTDKNNNDAFILGGSYKIPVVEGLQPANFIQTQETDNSMDEAAFEREYQSIWSGNLSGAFFNLNKFDQNRVLNVAELKYNKTISTRGYYVMGVDVGRLGDLTEIVVIKVTPMAGTNQSFLKQVVNIYTYDAMHFEKQAIYLKRIFNAYHCNMAVVDGNGVN